MHLLLFYFQIMNHLLTHPVPICIGTIAPPRGGDCYTLILILIIV
jgi:hypothetical protein